MGSGLIADFRISNQGRWILLCLILAVAFWLRFHHLGALGFHGDEDHTYFAAKGVLETGYPEMPSGMIYPRAIPFTYVAALSAAIFGLSEFSLRLPGVIFSLLTALVLYVLVRDIFGEWVALLVGAMYALSGWNIEVARQARMYEMFLFFWMLSTFAFYRGFIKGEKKYRLLVPPLFIFTTTIHLLGVFLLTLFCCPFLLKRYEIVSYRALVIYWLAIAAVNNWIRKISHRPYAEWLETSAIEFEADPEVVSALPKNLSLLNDLLSTGNWQALLVLGLLGIVSVLAALRLRTIAQRRPIHAWEWLAFLGLIATALTHQYAIAGLVLACAVFKNHEGFAKLRDPVYVTFMAFLCMTFVIWAGWGFFEYSGQYRASPLALGREIAKALFNPAFVLGLRRFFLIMPIMFVFVIGALIVLFHRLSREPRGGELVVVICFVGPLLAMGLLSATPLLRHVYMVYPFFLALYVWCIAALVQSMTRPLIWRSPSGYFWKPATIAASVVLTYAFSNQHSFAYAKSISERTYATRVERGLLGLKIQPDHKTAGLFVQERKGPRDVVIVMDFIASIYSGQMDYLLRTGGILAGIQAHTDIFTNAPILRSVEMLDAVIRPEEGKNIWLIGCAERLGPQRTRPGLSDEMMSFLASNNDKIVYTGEDGITQVYLWRH